MTIFLILCVVWVICGRFRLYHPYRFAWQGKIYRESEINQRPCVI